MSEPTPPLVCFQCGAEMHRGDAIYFQGKMEFGMPVFCSIRCCKNFKPESFTAHRLAGLSAQVKITCPTNPKN